MKTRRLSATYYVDAESESKRAPEGNLESAKGSMPLVHAARWHAFRAHTRRIESQSPEHHNLRRMAARRRIHAGRAMSRPRLRASAARCVPARLATRRRRRSQAQLSARCTGSVHRLSTAGREAFVSARKKSYPSARDSTHRTPRPRCDRLDTPRRRRSDRGLRVGCEWPSLPSVRESR